MQFTLSPLKWAGSFYLFGCSVMFRDHTYLVAAIASVARTLIVNARPLRSFSERLTLETVIILGTSTLLRGAAYTTHLKVYGLYLAFASFSYLIESQMTSPKKENPLPKTHDPFQELRALFSEYSTLHNNVAASREFLSELKEKEPNATKLLEIIENLFNPEKYPERREEYEMLIQIINSLQEAGTLRPSFV